MDANRAAEELKVNPKSPLERMFDAATNKWAILDPLQGASFTVKLQKPVTITKLRIMPGNDRDKTLPQIKNAVFLGDGRLIAKATLENTTQFQDIDLDQPATFKDLTLKVVSIYLTETEYGACMELEAYDTEGKNILLAKPYKVPRRSAEEVAAHYRRIKVADKSRPVFVTFTSHFMKEFRGHYDQATKDKIYPNFVKYCDVAGFDTYPIYGWNRPDWLDYPGRGVAQLRTIAGPKKPVYAWIETHKGSKWVSYEKQLDVLPCHTRNEVWLAIVRGATAIGYFTHAWRPTTTEFAPTNDMQQELKRLNGQITRLAPVILTEPAKVDVSITIENGLKADIMARKFDGSLYLFGVNCDPGQQAGLAEVKIAGLEAGTKIEVVDEARRLTAEQGRFTDQFAPLAVHIYKISAPL